MNNISSHNASYTEIFIQSAWSKGLAGIFAFVAIILTCTQIFFHIKHYTCSKEQRWIIRILFIIPIYGIHSFFSLVFLMFDNYVYFNSIRDIYEAFVIYSFLSLCYVYLDGESGILAELRGKVIPFSIPYCTCCFAGHPYTIVFLRFCKQATLQFCFIKPVMSILVIILQSQGLYVEGNFSLNLGYIYITIIYNFSISIALYGLLLFYFSCKELLYPFDPVLKFITIKAIIFLSFWQGVGLAILEKVGVIQPMSSTANSGTVAAGIQNFLICIELVLAAIGLWFAFPHGLYAESKRQKTSNASIYLISTIEEGPHCVAQQQQTAAAMATAATPSSSGDPSRLQTFSSRLGETMNPLDFVHDTVINFHPSYKSYIQQTQNG